MMIFVHWAGVGLMLDRRLRHWPGIEPLVWRWSSVVDVGPALNRL